MTEQDLHLMYRQETGKDVPEITTDMYDEDVSDCEEYVTWLEQKVQVAAGYDWYSKQRLAPLP